ncbi:CDP-glycerol glycerophosphotransferase family protein [Nocardioides sp. Kera G14]|uniref:CDP-glycerol glycerophosphotransferase family protein n=1 Tax=Nocardioides sp. Kera G14 TaxID=2884264 RepID=UPI001D0FEA8F|nr:CDP-glycerol glycerophosphotransferase family protein [Nocardioides sp. Kera G14]UDY24665.1 CDP-glycerol glycerophosphotransferase family protein [Nocardioides sp. Kera G14]
MLKAPTIDVIAYFADDPTRVYQLLQWLPVLEGLDPSHPVGIVTRDHDTAMVVRSSTTLPVFCAPEFHEMHELYPALDAKVAVYCNNSMRNFQSLLDNRLLHVHINHGESDKQSMVSNNAKAYDRVFVAGEAAAQRIVSGLLEFDDSKLVRIGRPQLDLQPEPIITESPRRTVLYAPTWEGDAEYNDYTSVDVFGAQIMAAILAVPDARVVYKPHPKVTTSEVPAVIEGHRAIMSLLESAAAAEPEAGHEAVLVGDILAVMPHCDAMITDVSSVGLDWLYLRTEKPILITDKHGDAEKLRQEVPVSRAADVLQAEDVNDIPGLTALVTARLEHDEHRIARAAMRHHYFDDVRVGESTQRFEAEIAALCELRDRLIGVAPSSDEAVTA